MQLLEIRGIKIHFLTVLLITVMSISSFAQNQVNSSLEWREKVSGADDVFLNAEQAKVQNIETPEAKAMLAYVYYQKGDYNKAYELAKRADEGGNGFGAFILGKLYLDGAGVEQDDDQAFFYYRKSADKGDIYGQNNLGSSYYNGSIIEQNSEKALQWFLKAAEQGNVVALENAGIVHYYGKNFPVDYMEAAYYYRKAAELGDMTAQNRLGDMYFEGVGLSKDNTEALKWYRMAAKQGHENAIQKAEYLELVLENSLACLGEIKSMIGDFVGIQDMNKEKKPNNRIVFQHTNEQNRSIQVEWMDNNNEIKFSFDQQKFENDRNSVSSKTAYSIMISQNTCKETSREVVYENKRDVANASEEIIPGLRTTMNFNSTCDLVGQQYTYLDTEGVDEYGQREWLENVISAAQSMCEWDKD